MSRAFVVSVVLSCVSCKSDPAPAADKTDGKAHSGQSDADQAKAAPPSSSPAKAGPGLAGAVKDALGSAKTSRGATLIPAGATGLMGVDVAAFVKQPVYATLKSRLGNRQRTQLEAATRCGVGPDKWRTFVIGFDSKTRDMAMVVEATGLGTKATLQCLVKEIGTFTLSEDGKSMSDHTGGGIVLDDDTIAFATPPWMDPLQQRIDGKGKAAIEASLKTLVARADQSKPLWFAGLIPTAMSTMASGTLGSTATNVSGGVTLSKEAGLQLAVGVSDPKVAREQLQTQWNAAKGFATVSGIPQAVANSVEFGHTDAVVTASLSASYSDIEAMLNAFAPR